MAEKPMSDDIISELTKKMLSYFRTKDTNKRNARKRVTKKQKSALADDGGYAKLQQAKKDAAKKKKMLAQRGKSPGALGGKTDVKQAKMSMPKKRPQSITALSVIKKDANIKTDKTPKKKVIVTKEQLRKSGLSLRDYMNFMQGKTRRDDKKSPPKKNSSSSKKSSSKVMVDSFKKSNVSANKNKKAGVDEAKGDNKKVKNYKKNTNKKLDSKGNYKGTNIKPTKLQLERMKKRRAKGAST